MKISIKERKTKIEKIYKAGELEILLPPIEKIVIYPTSYPALSLIKEAEVIRYDQGGMKGFLIKYREKIYWLRVKKTGDTIIEIIISKLNNSTKKWTDSEAVLLEEEKKELWVPIDEHFLFSGTPWLE